VTWSSNDDVESGETGRRGTLTDFPAVGGPVDFSLLCPSGCGRPRYFIVHSLRLKVASQYKQGRLVGCVERQLFTALVGTMIHNLMACGNLLMVSILVLCISKTKFKNSKFVLLDHDSTVTSRSYVRLLIIFIVPGKITFLCSSYTSIDWNYYCCLWQVKVPTFFKYFLICFPRHLQLPTVL
jgi:hypothetical protein